MSVFERFMRHVEKTNDCWLWKSKIRYDGYVNFKVDGKKFNAHRVIYEILVGVIPVGLELDHLCNNRACVNPEHLEPVTPAENSARRNERRHQILGHSPDWRTLKQGRICLTCRAISRKSWGTR